MITPHLRAIVRCPDCRGELDPGTAWRCRGCGRTFPARQDYLDLRPAAAFEEQTKYLEEALHADARHAAIAPPLLGSKIRNDMLRAFLALEPGDRVLDLGCGNGRALVWNADSGATLTGVDISPFFAAQAVAEHELVLGDLRRLPFHDASFEKAWSLDVLEHLSPQALRDVLREANRVLVPGGGLFVYTHVRKNGWPAVGVRLVNRLARVLERLGLLDLRQERLRKSDHLNPIADHDELESVLGECGFRLDRVTYYTPVIGAFVENVMVRMAESVLARRAARRLGPRADDPAAAVREARTSAQAALSRRGLAFRATRLLSSVMKLDILLFGRFRSGPFFALVRKKGTPSS